MPNIAATSAVGLEQFMDGSSTISANCSGIADLDKHFQEDLTGAKVTALADETVSRHGSPNLKHVNNAINSWLTTWNLRCFRESDYENRTFLNDPLPFFWLAKLYLVLDCHPLWKRDGSDFAVFRVPSTDDASKWRIQNKILGWLSQFRGRPRRPAETRAGNGLYKILELSDN